MNVVVSKEEGGGRRQSRATHKLDRISSESRALVKKGSGLRWDRSDRSRQDVHCQCIEYRFINIHTTFGKRKEERDKQSKKKLRVVRHQTRICSFLYSGAFEPPLPLLQCSTICSASLLVLTEHRVKGDYHLTQTRTKCDNLYEKRDRKSRTRRDKTESRDIICSIDQGNK